MKPNIFFILLILGVIPSHAQLDSIVRINKRSIDFNVGLAHQRLVDEGLSFSKLHFSGTTPQVHLGYFSKATQHLFSSSFSIGGGTVSSNEGNIDAGLLNIELLINYSRRFRYSLFGKQQELFAGLQFGSAIYYVDCAFLDNEDVLTLNGLYITLMQNIALGRSRNIQLKLTIPTVGYSKRIYADGGLNFPPGVPDAELIYSDGELVFLNKLQFSASYTKRIMPLTDLLVSYRFQYLSNNAGAPLRMYSNELHVGFKFYFRK